MSSAAQVLRAVQAAGLVITVEGDMLAAQPRANLTEELRTAIRAHKPELLSRLRDLRRSFDLTMQAFRTPDDEIAVCWSLALRDLDAAEASFNSTAAMLKAGWRPLKQQATAFLGREDVEP